MAKTSAGSSALWTAMRTWRTAAVSLLSFSSGLPLGLVWIAIPTWMARLDVDIKIIGLFTLAQAPWSFKFAWSPLMDRYSAPIASRGKKLGWTLVAQAALLVLTLMLAGVATHPDAIWIVGAVTLAIAFASATQDIAIDAYAVEVLRPEEQGVAVGARTAVYRAAMYISGGVTIWLASKWSWPGVFFLIALLYLPMMIVSLTAPRPDEPSDAGPPKSLRSIFWEPFVGFLSVDRALEILAFVVLYKLSDNLAGALVRPFLVQIGFNDFDVGVATATIGLAATLVGTFLGGVLTTAMGLGHALWIFGALQILSNIGYVAIAQVGVNRPVMYLAMSIESLTTGMGTGAFGVLLLRMTQKRFSATQYALFSSLFALPRLVAGPITGILVDAVGWRDFFLFTMLVGIPGMVMLQRFSPLGCREPRLEPLSGIVPGALSRGALAIRGIAGGAVGFCSATAAIALLGAMRAVHKNPEIGFDLLGPLGRLFSPDSTRGWVEVIGIVLFSVTLALGTAAAFAARSRRNF